MRAQSYLACEQCHLWVGHLKRGKPCPGCNIDGVKAVETPEPKVYFSVKAAVAARAGNPLAKDPGRFQKPRRGNSRRRNPGLVKSGSRRVVSARGPEPSASGRTEGLEATEWDPQK